MQAFELRNMSNSSVVLRTKEAVHQEYHISDEMRKDLEDVREGRNLIGPFDNLDDLWKELGI